MKMFERLLKAHEIWATNRQTSLTAVPTIAMLIFGDCIVLFLQKANYFREKKT
jgi:hypothetical protein